MIPSKVIVLPGLSKIELEPRIYKYFSTMKTEGTKRGKAISDKTLITYEKSLKTFRYFSKASFESLRPEHIRRIKNRYRKATEKAFEPWTETATKEEKGIIAQRIDDRIYNFMVVLQSYYNFLIEYKYMGDRTKKDSIQRYIDNPVTHVKKPRLSTKSPRKPFTKDEIRKLRHHAKYTRTGRFRKFWIRNRLLINLGLSLRLRTSEILEAQFSWFNSTFDDLEVVIPNFILKLGNEGNSIRTVFPSVLPELAEYFELCATDPENSGSRGNYLFAIGERHLQKMMNQWGREAGFSGCCWHRWGNTLVSLMDELGHSKSEIDFKGGWSLKGRTSERYNTRPPSSLLKGAKEFDKKLEVVV